MDYKDSSSYDENKDDSLRNTYFNNYSSLNYYTGHLQKAFYNVSPTVSYITRKMFVYTPSIPKDMITIGYKYTGTGISSGLDLFKKMKSFALLPMTITNNINIHIYYNQKKEDT